MNPSGKSAGGGGKGGKSKASKGSKDDDSRHFALTTAKAHVVKLRKCLQTDEGLDKVA